jgi:hypothetical protein
VVIFGSPKTLGDSPNARLVVKMAEGALVKTADRMEQQLPTSLSEPQIPEFIEDDEVQSGEISGEPSLATSASFSLEAVDQGGTDSDGQQGGGTITGGLGKFAGVKGKMTYQCKPIDAAKEIVGCTQQFDYQLATKE